MRPRLRVHLAGGLLLDGVVTDRSRCVQGFLEVARFEKGGRFPGFQGGEPDTCKAVGLELQGDTGFIGARALDLLGNTQLMLDVMTNLVGQDLGLGGVTGCAKPALQLAEEVQIRVDQLVDRTVVGP